MEYKWVDEWLYSLDSTTLSIVSGLVDYVYKDIRRRVLDEGGAKAECLKVIERDSIYV